MGHHRFRILPWLFLVLLLAFAGPAASGYTPPAAPTSASPWSWEIERAELSRTFSNLGPRSLLVDPAGRPHIAYRAGNDLFYAHAIPCVALSGVTIDGPARLSAGHSGLYTATYAPYSSTVVTLDWDNSTAGPQAAYSWPLTGTYSLAVTATNACSGVTATAAVEVVCQAPEQVQVAGPAVLVPGLVGTYVASAQPPTASLPLTWTWDNGAQGPAADYSWPASGTYTVSVTETNGCGQAGGRRQVQVLAGWPYRFCLPLLSRE